MKKLFHQMIKFGLVGVICFVIDLYHGTDCFKRAYGTVYGCVV